MDRSSAHAPSSAPHGTTPPHAKGHAWTLRLVAWEVTRSCNLSCVHCRAAAMDRPYADELTTEEGLRLLEAIATLGSPIVILTGGEPLLRPDIFDLAAHGHAKGLRMTMALNGTLVTLEAARRMKEVGIQRISISLDGANAASHDAFRQVPGAFEGALMGIRHAKAADLPFQINTTITASNLKELPRIQELAVKLGAMAHHIFLLVPVGRGKTLQEQSINAEQYEQTLHWFYEQRDKVPLQLKATCAPHYYRILRQRARQEGRSLDRQTFGLDAMTRGCLGGTGFCFISHVGDVQPCGYLEVNCGNVREESFPKIWENSKVFQRLRNFRALEGKCGRCEYVRVCGGCRARAYEATGDYMAEEPLCLYKPKAPIPNTAGSRERACEKADDSY
ncbi:heme b synthase [Desulfosoma sp.]|uniref:heme b synthase n=1 Tax=Desulfosoma sp. TaxID=2603217 RepID=UPI00404B654F